MVRTADDREAAQAQGDEERQGDRHGRVHESAGDRDVEPDDIAHGEQAQERAEAGRRAAPQRAGLRSGGPGEDEHREGRDEGRARDVGQVPEVDPPEADIRRPAAELTDEPDDCEPGEQRRPTAGDDRDEAPSAHDRPTAPGPLV